VLVWGNLTNERPACNEKRLPPKEESRDPTALGLEWILAKHPMTVWVHDY
jgi:hypothetical protein